MYFSHAGSNLGSPHFFLLFFFYILIILPFPVSSVCVCGGGGGGGGRTSPLWIHHWIGPPVWILSFIFIRRLGTSICGLPPKNIGNIRKIFEILQPQTILILYIYLMKRPRNTWKRPLKLVQFCDDAKKISTKYSYPKNINFSENP